MFCCRSVLRGPLLRCVRASRSFASTSVRPQVSRENLHILSQLEDGEFKDQIQKMLTDSSFQAKFIQSVSFFKTLLKPHFDITDEMAILMANPTSSMSLMQSIDGKIVRTPIQSVEIVGKRFYKLTLAQYVLSMAGEFAPQKSSIQKNILDHFVSRYFMYDLGFNDHIIVPNGSLKSTVITAAMSAYHTMFGILLLTYGAAKTREFIIKFVIESPSGVLNIAKDYQKNKKYTHTAMPDTD